MNSYHDIWNDLINHPKRQKFDMPPDFQAKALVSTRQFVLA